MTSASYAHAGIFESRQFKAAVDW